MNDPLTSARVAVRASSDKGSKCPVCGRLVKKYKRKIHREQVVFLAKLQAACDLRPGNYFSPRDILPRQSKASTDATFLLLWGLMEGVPDSTTPKRGRYRITRRGRDFLAGRSKEAAAVYLLCGEVIGWDKTYVDVHTAFGERFDYGSIRFP